MRLVQSHWSKPLLVSHRQGADDRHNGGWMELKYQYYSWALSTLTARAAHGQVDLVTDRIGKSVLVDGLRLPFDKVTVVLDDINHYPAEFWALGKLFTYAIQKEPFIHFDNDIYLWRPLPFRLSSSPLVAQHKEAGLTYYSEALQFADELGIELPSFVNDKNREQMQSSNAGIIGGTHLEFFKTFSQHAFGFVDRYADRLIKFTNPSLFNVIFEQLFYHHLSVSRNVEIEYLLQGVNPHEKELARFHRAPMETHYIHVFGKQMKKRLALIDKIELTLRLDFPWYFHRANALLREFQI